MTASTLPDWRPRPDRVHHSYRCPRRAPLLDAVRTLDDGRTVPFRRCGSCEGTDLAAVLAAMLDPGGDAA